MAKGALKTSKGAACVNGKVQHVSGFTWNLGRFVRNCNGQLISEGWCCFKPRRWAGWGVDA
eukprot:1091309-Rhodomonas_salina.1